MFLQVLSADGAYADIAFFVILALGLVLGILRGFSKSFKGIFLTLGILLISLLILSPVFTQVRTIDSFQKMEQSITQSFESKSELLAKPIFLDTDENGKTVYLVEKTNDDGTTQLVDLNKCIEEGDLKGAMKAKTTLWLAQKFIKESGTSVGSVAGVFITDIIVAAITYVIICVVLGLICWLLRKIFKSMRESESSTLKTIDRVFGAVVSTAFALIFIFLVLAILYTLREKTGSVDAALRDSTVCGYFYEHNPVSKLFAEIFG